MPKKRSNTKPNFSIVFIAKNEEKTIGKMLQSLDEFIKRGGDCVLVDTGSSDRTVDIAREHGCRCFEVGAKFVFTISEEQATAINDLFSDGEGEIVKPGDTLFNFSAARNYAASLAENDMISNQDCDEAYTKLDIDKICELINLGYEQFEYNFVFSHDQFGREEVKFIQSKFYNRKKLQWVGIVHEVLQPIVQTEIKRLLLGEDILKLEHWQNPETPRGQYLKGLALDCFLNRDNDRNSHYFARELLWSGKPKSAIKEFKRHIAMNRWRPEMAQSMIYMGDAYGALNDGDAQIDCYHKAFILDSSRRQSLLKLANFFRYHNEPMKTAAYTAAAMQIPWDAFYANHRSHYEQEPHELMYWAKGWLGDIEAAKEHLLKALEFQPYNPIYLRDTKFYFEYPDNGIEGWMRYPELLFLYENAKLMDTIAEVGSWKGRSTHALCSGCKNGEVIAIDHFLGSNEPQHFGKAKDDAIYKEFLKNTSQFMNLKVIRSSSLEAAEKFEDKSIDMVFIDASHTYEDVKKDIRAWKNKAKILLCGHDFCNEWPEVRRAVIEELGAVKVCDSIWYKYMFDFPKVSILIPTLGREEKLQRLLSDIEKNAGYPFYEIIVESDSFENRQGVPKVLKRAVEKSTGELVMFLGNDCIPQKNFLLNAVITMAKYFPEMDGLVGLNDCYWAGEFATHWLASKKLLPLLGGEFFHTGYHHTGCDNELTERCRMMGKYVWAEEARVFHDHPVQKGFKTWDMDEVYTLAYDAKAMEEDKALLYERAKQFGFSVKHSFSSPRRYPNVHPSIDLRRIIKAAPKLRVLNVGIGPGTSSLASQLPFFRFKRLDHIDIHLPYLEEGQRPNLIWDAQEVNFIHKDIREVTDFSEYDLVLLFDLVEHLPKEDGIALLKRVPSALVFAPIEATPRKNVDGVESQEHLSTWAVDDFEKLGYTVTILSKFHGEYDAVWASKFANRSELPESIVNEPYQNPNIKTSVAMKESQKIPKIVYTIWLNEDPHIPEIVQRCIQSRKNILHDYEHRIITLENCLRTSRYVIEALESKRWVKAADFLRMQYLYETGGIYLDADCEVIKTFDDLLYDRLFVGVEESGTYANGIIGVEPKHPLIGEYLRRIEENFRGNGDLVFEPGIRAFTDLIFIADKEKLGIKIYEKDYFFPFSQRTGELAITENTRLIHHYMRSWIKKNGDT